MKEEWALIDDNGGRHYKRVINGTNFRIREFNKDTFGLSYDCVIINRSYQDYIGRQIFHIKFLIKKQISFIRIEAVQ